MTAKVFDSRVDAELLTGTKDTGDNALFSVAASAKFVHDLDHL